MKKICDGLAGICREVKKTIEVFKGLKTYEKIYFCILLAIFIASTVILFKFKNGNEYNNTYITITSFVFRYLLITCLDMFNKDSLAEKQKKLSELEVKDKMNTLNNAKDRETSKKVIEMKKEYDQEKTDREFLQSVVSFVTNGVIAILIVTLYITEYIIN